MSTLRKNVKIVTWDKFCDKFKNYILKNFRYSEYIGCIATDMNYPTMDFEEIHMPEYLTEDKEKRPSKQKMWEIKLKKYLDEEYIIQENKNKMYVIVIGHCISSLQSKIK